MIFNENNPKQQKLGRRLYLNHIQNKNPELDKKEVARRLRCIISWEKILRPLRGGKS